MAKEVIGNDTLLRCIYVPSAQGILIIDAGIDKLTLPPQ